MDVYITFKRLVFWWNSHYFLTLCLPEKPLGARGGKEHFTLQKKKLYIAKKTPKHKTKTNKEPKPQNPHTRHGAVNSLGDSLAFSPPYHLQPTASTR